MATISTVNAIPVMTSNTTPSGIVSASSVVSTSYEAWKAFDGIDFTTSWQTANSTTSGWLKYEFTTPKIIGKYLIKTWSNTVTADPKNWTFEGSNDGTNWTILDTQTNQFGVTSSNTREYVISNPSGYKAYRLNVSANNGAGNLALSSLEMYEIIYEKRMGVINPTTSKAYSIDNNTLISLPSSSDRNMILHGLEAGKEIKLDEDFDKMKYVKDTSEVLGAGKTFSHTVDTTKVKVNKLIL